MKFNIKRTLQILLPLLAGVIFVWYSLAQISIEELIKYFKKADYTWVFLGTFLGFLSHLLRAYRWRFLLEPMGYKIKLGNSVMAVFAAYLINYTIPRAGELARASVLTNYEGVPLEKGFGTIVAERIADMMVMLTIIVVTLFLEFDFIYNLLTKTFDLTKILIGTLIIVALMVFIVFVIRKGKSKLALKIKTFVNGLIEGSISIFKMKKKWTFFFHTLLIWGIYLLMFYVTSFSLPQTQNIPFAAILIGFIAASFSIAATNGGIGSYPEAIVLVFTLFNLPEDPSRAFGWIMWTSQTLMIIILGGLSLIYLPIFNRK